MESGWRGRRVTVRRTLDEPGPRGPRYSDVVGDLVALDDETATVETRSGLVSVPVEDIAIARLALPSTADELALESTAAAGWRADETSEIGGWLLRASAGFTSRANSVLPLRAPGCPLDEALERARVWYAERGLPLRLQIPTEARRLLDAELGERGWPHSPDVHVLAARLDCLDAGPATVPVDVCDTPDEAWLERFRDGAGTQPAARRILTRHDRAAFATIRENGSAVAIGRGCVDGDWLGITALEVDASRRRLGLGSAVMRALCRWGAEQGARRSYLQVAADNAAALALYEAMGYWRHHDYRYRTAPAAAGQS